MRASKAPNEAEKVMTDVKVTPQTIHFPQLRLRFTPFFFAPSEREAVALRTRFPRGPLDLEEDPEDEAAPLTTLTPKFWLTMMTLIEDYSSEELQLISYVTLNAVVASLWRAQRYDSTQLIQPFKGRLNIFCSHPKFGHRINICQLNFL